MNGCQFFRFKIDDRFKDDKKRSVSEEPSDSDEEDDDDVGAERQLNLDVLNGVMKSKGSTEENHKKKPGAMFKDNSNMRFDPLR